MSKEKVIAAAGSLTLHGLCVAGLFFWKTDLSQSPSAAVVQETERPSLSVVPLADSTASRGDRTVVAAAVSEELSQQHPANPKDSSSSALNPESRKMSKKSALIAASKGAPIVEGSYSWPEGEKRKKVSGPLPRPLNAGKSSKDVSLDLTVSPNGTVRAIKVLEPSNSGFEREAVRVLRRWRFEVLPRSKPQRDNHCVVTLRIKH